MEKPFSADEIEHVEFPTALRGYDRDEVDDYLRMIASDFRQLQQLASTVTKTTDKPYEMLGQDIGQLLQQAKDTADKMKRKAETEAASVRLRVQEDATRRRKEATEAAKKIVEDARIEAKDIRTAAEREAAEHLKEAARRIQRLQATETDLSRRLTSIESTLQTVQRELETSKGTSLAQEVAQLSELRRSTRPDEQEDARGREQDSFTPEEPFLIEEPANRPS